MQNTASGLWCGLCKSMMLKVPTSAHIQLVPPTHCLLFIVLQLPEGVFRSAHFHVKPENTCAVCLAHMSLCLAYYTCVTFVCEAGASRSASLSDDLMTVRSCIIPTRMHTLLWMCCECWFHNTFQCLHCRLQQCSNSGSDSPGTSSFDMAFAAVPSVPPPPVWGHTDVVCNSL